MSTADLLVNQLSHCKEISPRRWIARCPSHSDNNPSLSIRETDDGIILIKCWSGCCATEIVASIGLEMHDLFPDSPDNRAALAPRERWIPRDVIRVLAEECMVVVIAASALAAGKKLTLEDNDRLVVAARRFHAAAREVGYA